MKIKTIAILLALSLPSLCFGASSVFNNAPQNTGLSFFISGDLHGGITYDDFEKDDATFYPISLRLQPTLKYGNNFELQSRFNTLAVSGSELNYSDRFIVDRLFFAWRKIMSMPLTFSFGRLPTMGNNAPTFVRMGLDRPESELLTFTDIILDGASLGYKISQENWTENLTLYAASQYDEGYEEYIRGNLLEDSEIYGINLTVQNKKDATFIFQSFAFNDIYNFPEEIFFVNPLEYTTFGSPSPYASNFYIDRTNLGNIYHTSLTYQAANQGLNYFLALGWSRTDAKNVDELGTSLLGSWWDEPEDKDGYSLYSGLRYDFTESRLKLGLELNYGSENWISFTAPDEFYMSKLTTRGYAAEVYTIYDIPTDAFQTNLKNGFIRLGYQYLHYEYTGNGFWLGKPQDIDMLKNDPLNAQFYTPVDHEERVYLAVDLYF